MSWGIIAYICLVKMKANEWADHQDYLAIILRVPWNKLLYAGPGPAYNLFSVLSRLIAKGNVKIESDVSVDVSDVSEV